MKCSTGRGADDAWTVATLADVDVLDRDGLQDVLVALRMARSRLDAVEVRVARRLRHLAEQGHSESAEHAISCGVGRSGRDAKDVTERDEICEQQPELEDALDAGDLTGAHLDAIRRVANKLPDDVRAEFLGYTDALLAKATSMSPDRFARECRDLAKHLLAVSRRGRSDSEELEAQRAASKVTRWVDEASGMHNTLLELDPVRDAKLKKAVDRALARLRSQAKQAGVRVPWQQQHVDATLDAITGDERSAAPIADTGDTTGDTGDTGDATSRTGDTTGGTGDTTGATGDAAGGRCHCGSSLSGSGSVDRVPDISVVVDLATLLDLADVSGVCETVDGVALPVSTVRRLCCDAEIIPTVLDGASTVVDHGRSKRTASREQRQALRSMYSTCAHPACSVGFDDCRVHHVRHWLEHRGTTDLENLLPVCEHHHHLVHEGGWTLTMTSDRITTWARADGSIYTTGVSTNRHPVGT